MTVVVVNSLINAPRAAVYAAFTDREGTGKHLPIQVKLKTEGTTERQGVGAVHTLGMGPLVVSERITELVPNEKIVYELVSGAPVKSHVGTIEFSDADGGTNVSYRIDSVPLVPAPDAAVSVAPKQIINTLVAGVRKAVTP